MSIFNQAGKKVTDTVSRMQKKANESIAVSKLQGQIKTSQSEMEGLYRSIGEAVYKAHIDGTEAEGLDELFAGVTAIIERIDGYTNEIDKLNDVRRCPGCGAQVSRDALFCPKCGTKMPEEAPEEPAQEEAPAAEEKCPECGEVRDGDSRFCQKCGHDFAPADAAEANEEPEVHEE